MSQSTRAKQLRRQAESAVRAHADSIRDGVIIELLGNLYRAPITVRLKWALRIVRGERRESLWMHKVIWTADWMLETFTRWAGDKIWPKQIVEHPKTVKGGINDHPIINPPKTPLVGQGKR